MGRTTSLLLVLVCSAMTLGAQDGGDAEAKSRELSQRMRRTLGQQSRELSRMQRELERATRADGRVRDSIVRVTSKRIAELAGEIARVQMEADRVQSGDVDAETRAALTAQIASAQAMANVTRALAGQQRQLIFSTRAAPRGYLGVVLESEQRTRIRNGKVFTEFVSPSVVLSVTAGSPAAKAGIEAGDTITALGRAPLPGEVLMSEVVKPGEKLPVKLRRRGGERVVNVVVGNDPNAVTAPSISYYDMNGETMRVCNGDNCSTMIAGMRGQPGVPGNVTVTVPPAPPGVATTPRATPAPAPAPAVRVFERGATWSATDYTFGGAMMTSINSDLEGLTGVDEGILVLRVAPGTPAAESGLRGGDVIIRVNDDDCEGVRDLQRAVQRASSRGGRSVSLVVNRKKKDQAITLQW
ncbi:MAG: PDZ domain-containing protein [Gemmatimonadota bacterium]